MTNNIQIDIQQAFNNCQIVKKSFDQGQTVKYLGRGFAVVPRPEEMSDPTALLLDLLAKLPSSEVTNRIEVAEIMINDGIGYIYSLIFPQNKEFIKKICNTALRILFIQRDLSYLLFVKQFIAADTRSTALYHWKRKVDEALVKVTAQPASHTVDRKKQRKPLDGKIFAIPPLLFKEMKSSEDFAILLKFAPKKSDRIYKFLFCNYSQEELDTLKYFSSNGRGTTQRFASTLLTGYQANQSADLCSKKNDDLFRCISFAYTNKLLQNRGFVERIQKKYPLSCILLKDMQTDLILTRRNAQGLTPQQTDSLDTQLDKDYFKTHIPMQVKLDASTEETALDADYTKFYRERLDLLHCLPEILVKEGAVALEQSLFPCFISDEPLFLPSPANFTTISRYKNEGIPEALLAAKPNLKPEEKKEEKVDASPLEAILSKKQFPFAGEIQCDPRLQTQTDPRHAFPAELDQFLGTSYSLKGVWHNPTTGNDDTLYLMIGNLGEERGVFQYCFDSEGILYHRFFGKTSNVELCDTIIKGTFFEMDFPTLAKSAQKRPKQKQETLSTTQGMKIEMDPHSKILTFMDTSTHSTKAQLYEFGKDTE